MVSGAEHAAYLWAAYGITGVTLLYNLYAAVRLKRRVLRELRAAEAPPSP